MIPTDLRGRVTSDMWKKYTCAPVERKAGVLVMVIDDPHDMMRLDGVRAMNMSPRYDFQVGLKPDILAYIANSYGEAAPGESTAAGDLARIITELGEGEAEVEEEKNPDIPEIDETPPAPWEAAAQRPPTAFLWAAAAMDAAQTSQRFMRWSPLDRFPACSPRIFARHAWRQCR